MTSPTTALRLRDLQEREREIEIRLKCARIAAEFYPQPDHTGTIAFVSQVVYDWVTRVDGE